MHSFAHSFSNATGNEMIRAQMDHEMLSKYSAEFAIGGKILIFK